MTFAVDDCCCILLFTNYINYEMSKSLSEELVRLASVNETIKTEIHNQTNS